MIHHAIESVDRILETKYYEGKLESETAIKFMDVLVDAIPSIIDLGNYGRALSKYRKWRTLLHDQFDIFYEKKLDIELKFNPQRMAWNV